MPNIMAPSVQSLLLEMSFQGTPLSTGTGFIANSPQGPVLVTNLHNVTGRNIHSGQPLSAHGGTPDEISIWHNHVNGLGNWVKKMEKLYDSNGQRWVEHPTFGNTVDFVALPLIELGDVQLYPYDLVNTGPDILIAPADPVSVVGFPFGFSVGGLMAIWATGFVASEPSVDVENKPVFLIDCRTRPGQSGSAVIAHRNGGALALEDGSTAIFTGPVTRILGIYSGRINDQSDIGVAWKVSAINDLVLSIT
jgi:hypothetical protein